MPEPIAAPTPGLDLGHHYGHHQTPAIRACGLIFCSGMAAVNPETGDREHGTITSETRRIVENLELLLESIPPPAGAILARSPSRFARGRATWRRCSNQPARRSIGP